MRHPLHITLSVPVPAPGPAVTGRVAARHRKPSPVRLAAGLGLASVLAASVLTAAVDPRAPEAPDRAPAGRSSTFGQLSGD